jgi:hypothetical protein
VGDADDEVETVALANDDGDVEGDPEEDLVAEFVGVACEEGDVDDDGDKDPVGEFVADVVGVA